MFTKVKFSFTIDTVSVSLFTKSTVSFIAALNTSLYTEIVGEIQIVGRSKIIGEIKRYWEKQR